MIEQCVERGTNGSAGVEHVIDQDDVLAGDREIDFGGAVNRLFGNGGKIVAVKIDVEESDRDREVLEILDLFGETEREGNAAAADSDEGQAIQIFGFLENLVGQTHQGAVDLGGAHQLCFFACGNHECGEAGRGLDERNIVHSASKPSEPVVNTFGEPVDVVGLFQRADREDVVVAFLQINLQFVG